MVNYVVVSVMEQETMTFSTELEALAFMNMLWNGNRKVLRLERRELISSFNNGECFNYEPFEVEFAFPASYLKT